MAESILEDLQEKAAESAEALADQAKAAQIADLELEAFTWIARGREANMKLGRVFNQIKDLVGHGQWESYYSERFQGSVAIRTAQEYMKMAREEDKAIKNAESAFLPATDQQAIEVKEAVTMAQEQVTNAPAPESTSEGDAPTPTTQPNPQPKGKPRGRSGGKKEKVRLSDGGDYTLKLYGLSGDEKDGLDALFKSQNGGAANKQLLATARRLLVQYGYAEDPQAKAAQPAEPRMNFAQRRKINFSDQPDCEPYPGAMEDANHATATA